MRLVRLIRDIAGKTRRRVAADELAEVVAVEAKMKKATNDLEAAGRDEIPALTDQSSVS